MQPFHLNYDHAHLHEPDHNTSVDPHGETMKTSNENHHQDEGGSIKQEESEEAQQRHLRHVGNLDDSQLGLTGDVESRTSHVSVIQLRPFTQNNPVHIIHDASAAPLTNSVKIDQSQLSEAALKESQSKPVIPRLNTSHISPEFSHEGSLTDTEQLVNRRHQQQQVAKKPKESVKTSLYEIREEVY